MAARKVWCIYNWDDEAPVVVSAWGAEDRALTALEEEQAKAPNSVLFINEVTLD